tara:strand:- start:5267 stop:5914 length:648 start_codon:yes stop_codon:yes gene_type:complete
MGYTMATDVQREDSASIMRFDIPAQALENALAQYGEITGMSVLVATQVTTGLRSAPVQGMLSIREALEALLKGTQLRVRYASPTAFTLLPPLGSTGKEALLKAKSNDQKKKQRSSGYAGYIQEAVTRTLCQKRVQDYGRYQARLQLWINPEGRIVRVHVVASSGRSERDRALVQYLTDTIIERSRPVTLVQPVMIRLVPRPDAMADCRAFGIASR